MIWSHGRRLVQSLAMVALSLIAGSGGLDKASGWLAARSSDTIARALDIVMLACIVGQVLVGVVALVRTRRQRDLRVAWGGVLTTRAMWQ